jgi:drug/metabolite transporter (DMT)-like permease
VKTKRLGVIAILFASIIWSIEPILAKISYQNSDFIQTSAIRAVFASVTAFIYVIFTKNKKHLKTNKKNISYLLYIAIIGTLLADIMYFYSLSLIPVINAVLIGHLQPIFIILFGFLVLKSEKLTKFDFFGISMMIISGILVTTKTYENLLYLNIGTIGDIIVLISTIAWATTAIVMRKYLRQMNSGVITFYRFFFASIFFLIYMIFSKSLVISNIYQIIIGILIGIGTILYYEGLKRIKAAQVSALELSTPFFAAILAFIFLREYVTVMQIIGIFFLFIGIFFISKNEN